MLRRNSLILCLMGFCLLMLSGSLQAQTLFGAAKGVSGSSAGSSLYSIDPATGDATLIGPIGFESVSGMAFLPGGHLVASARGDSLTGGGPSAVLISINPFNGAGALIGTIYDLGNGDNCGRAPGLTYDEVTGTLFAYSDFCNPGFEGLYSVNPATGAGTPVGPTGYSGGGNGLDAQPGTGALFATPFDNASLVSINPATGAGTDVPGSVGNVPIRVNSLDFHPVSGVLYGSWNDASSGNSFLVTISTSDGTTTTIGQTARGMDGLVFEVYGLRAPSVPIPTLNVSLLIMLGLLLAFSGRKFLRHRV